MKPLMEDDRGSDFYFVVRTIVFFGVWIACAIAGGVLGFDHLVLSPSDGCRDRQGACIDRNRDTCIAPKLPSLTFLAASVASLPPSAPASVGTA